MSISSNALAVDSAPTVLKRAAVLYPSGNTTAVVFDEPQRVGRKSLNRKILRAWKQLRPDKPEIEQCCFVMQSNLQGAIAKVEMFGGEFCANATRSVIWLLKKGRNSSGSIEVSGVDRPLSFEIKDRIVSLDMPLPQGKSFVRRVEEGILIQLDGIMQLVVIAVDARRRQSPRQLLRALLSTNKYGLAKQFCVGVSYYNPRSNKAKFCVWIKEVDTFFDETACGSGTCAIGVALATMLESSVAFSVVQPSGERIDTVAMYQSGKVTKSRISGGVNKLYEGGLELL